MTPVERGRPVKCVATPEEGVPSAPPLMTTDPATPTSTPSAAGTPRPGTIVVAALAPLPTSSPDKDAAPKPPDRRGKIPVNHEIGMLQAWVEGSIVPNCTQVPVLSAKVELLRRWSSGACRHPPGRASAPD